MQVAPVNRGIAIDSILQRNVALSSAQLKANVQFGRSIHGSVDPSSLATVRIFLRRRLQNEEARAVEQLTGHRVSR
jgi:hypothetical protein